MIWPPQIPDLNPIEKLGDELNKKVCMIAPINIQKCV